MSEYCNELCVKRQRPEAICPVCDAWTEREKFLHMWFKFGFIKAAMQSLVTGLKTLLKQVGFFAAERPVVKVDMFSPNNTETRFDLFISYASADSVVDIGGRRVRLIETLKRTLESHSYPSSKDKQAKRFRVCTDEEDFELGETVWEVIREKISQCQSLLVLTSNAATRSEYVQGELRIYNDLRQGKPLAAAWNLLPEHAFPSYFKKGDLAANLGSRPSIALKAWLQQVENESHKIVAKVWNLSLQDVHNRFERERKKRQRRMFLVGLVSTILLLITGAWGLQSYQINRRQQEHNNAVFAMQRSGFEVVEMDAHGEVSLIFNPFPGSQYEDPYLNYAVKGLAHIKSLMRVHTINLHGQPVTDEAIKEVGKLALLKQLWLYDTNITDLSLESIMKLKDLESLQITGVRHKVTDNGIKKLQEVLPNCKIELSRR